MTELFENIQKPETAVLVGVDLGEYDCEASLDELEELAKTAGAEVEARVTQRRETPDSATFIGSGRLREIKNFCADNDVDLLIFDSELTPSQQRNIEDITDVRVVDRTQLILDIFAARARSGSSSGATSAPSVVKPYVNGISAFLSGNAVLRMRLFMNGYA